MDGKKNWIKFKVGLFRDPKHRQRMGESVWLYGHMLDIADWETGVIDGWKDPDAADDMAMGLSTVRKHRDRLEELGYIQTERQGPKGMRIVIVKWVNPRSYSGDVLNAESDTPYSTLEEGDQAVESAPNVALSKKSAMESATESATDIAIHGSTLSGDSKIKNQESGIKPPDSPAPSSKSETEKVLHKHPAIQAYRDAAHRYPPKDWYQDVADQVGNDEATLARWRALVKDWIGRGWNPGNVKGMLDAFQAGGIAASPNGRGAPGRPRPDQHGKEFSEESKAIIRQMGERNHQNSLRIQEELRKEREGKR